jgi:hypothetical protein
LLQVTPLAARPILQSFTRALWSLFLPVGAVLLVGQAAHSWGQLAAPMESLTWPIAVNVQVLLTAEVVRTGGGLVTMVTGLFALAWVGMWMGLTTVRTPIAVLKTLLLAVVLPWLGLLYVQPWLEGRMKLPYARPGAWMGPARVLIMTLAVHAGLIWLARHRVRRLMTDLGGGSVGCAPSAAESRCRMVP